MEASTVQHETRPHSRKYVPLPRF